MGGRKMFRKLVLAEFTLDQTGGRLTFKEGVPVRWDMLLGRRTNKSTSVEICQALPW